MRYIRKGKAPAFFTEWTHSVDPNWNPSFEDLQNPIKSELKSALLAEQGGICCYCERSVSESDSHIEHLDPQSSPTGAKKTLAYDNLLCSCMKETRRGMPLTCGHYRGNWDGPDFITPFETDCGSHFANTGEGEISGIQTGGKRAEATIAKLNLNEPVLLDRRKKVLDSFFLDLDLEKAEVQKLAQSYAKLNESGFYRPGFPSMFEYLFLRN
jgi:uncharacterized protein (TIGR02646 family)